MKNKGEFPYGGIIRIRSMGMISASPNEQAPLSSHSGNLCKGNEFLSYLQTGKEKTGSVFLFGCRKRRGQLFLMAGSAFWWQLSGDVRFTQS